MNRNIRQRTIYQLR